MSTKEHVYIKQGMPGRRRRRYSAEFKVKVAEECRRSGVSIASVALANGLNANLLRKWVVEREGVGSPPPELPAVAPSEEFVAMPLVAAAKPAEGADIRIELRRGATTVTIRWHRRPAIVRPGCVSGCG